MDKHWIGALRISRSNSIGYFHLLSPLSLRSWFITQRLYYGKDLRIEELAEVTGTSVDQITERYFRLDMSRSYDHLSAGGYDRGDKEITLNKDGFYNGFK